MDEKLPAKFVQDVFGDDVITDDSFEGEQRSGGDGPADRKLVQLQNEGQQPQEAQIPQQQSFQPLQRPTDQTSVPKQETQTGITDAERQELQQLRERSARLDERGRFARELWEEKQRENARLEAEKTAREAEERRAKERPDPLVDPQGAEMFDLREQLRQQSQVITEINNRLTVRDSEQQGNSLQNWVSNEFGFARTRHADFDAAVDHLRADLVAELGQLKIVDPEIVNRNIQQKLMTVAQIAAQSGLSLGELIYSEAVRKGYQPGTQASVTIPQPSGSSAKLEQLRKGQALSGMGREPTAPASTQSFNMQEALLNMSDEEVSRLINGPDGERFLALFEQLETGATVQ